jgi:predicted naringenin-chalcone synthase
MSAYIHDIVTKAPSFSVDQLELRDFVKSKYPDNRRAQAIIHRLYSQSGIQTRHTIMTDILSTEPDAIFNRMLTPGKAPATEERNLRYIDESKKLFVDIAKTLLENNPEFKKEDITHVVTASCTGFFAPGPAFEIVKELGLSPNTERYHVGFMGCFAAFPILKMANSFCLNDPNANVLVVTTELCTIHQQYEVSIDNMIAASVFADGSAGAIVSSKEPKNKGFKLDQFASSLAYEGERDMAWTIGNLGFNMVLSAYVPDIISARLEEVIQPLFDKLSVKKEEIKKWGVHPGGRAIVDKVEEALSLSENQVASSRKVLHDYGNMSSATVMFVLEDILRSDMNDGDRVLPITFGPGLSIESGIFTFVNS